MDYICIGQEDWDDMWRRTQPLLAGVARCCPHIRLFFVEQPFDLAAAVRSGEILHHDSAPRRKMRDWKQGTRRSQDTPNVFLIRLLCPFPDGWPAGRTLNRFFERLQLRLLLRRLGARQPILWISDPTRSALVGHVGELLSVYDASDDWSYAAGTSVERSLMRDGQEKLASACTIVAACSNTLLRKWRPLNPQTIFLPNAVDYDHYATVREGTAIPAPEIRHLSWPVLIYSGTLHEDRLDIDLIRTLAVQRPHYTILLLGPSALAPRSEEILRALPNVIMPGAKPYASLAHYFAVANACLLPHVVSPFTESLNPIKIFDYFATGLPIVSTDVATVRDFGDAVYLAHDHEQFVRLVDIALSDTDAVARQHRLTLAKANSWEQRVATLISAIASHLDKHTSKAT